VMNKTISDKLLSKLPQRVEVVLANQNLSVPNLPLNQNPLANTTVIRNQN
jgi:hypothetical protein